jgi:class 3 adenylate cyclase
MSLPIGSCSALSQDNVSLQFTNYADKVLSELHTNVERRIQGVEALGVAVTSYAKSSNSKWPLVTVPDFDILGASARAIANASYVFMFPVVTNAQRNAWETYSVENQGWLSQPSEVWDDANASQTMNSTVDMSANANGNESTSAPSGIYGEIYEFSIDGPAQSKGPGPFLPFWQMSPPNSIPSTVINFNAISLPDVRNSVYAVLRSKKAVMSELIDYQVNISDYKDYGQDFHRKPKSEPTNNIQYPVFDSFTRNRSLVAILTLDFTWGAILEGLLPDGANGVDIVIENACNQAMTYRLNGPEATYLGTGDLHDRSFDGMEATLSLNQDITTGPNGVELNTMYCPYIVLAYPSREFHNEYITNKPIVMTVIVVAIFVFTSLVFFTYDRLVERRQTKVMKTAVRSSRIVSSLFPSNVRDRLFQINEPGQPDAVGMRKSLALSSRKGDGWRLTADSPKHLLKIFLSSNDGDEPGRALMSDHINVARPIADLFPNTTVLFADISGFTAWSSAREPSQVFTLLETVYNAFDKIAKRKGVFKVETIGDCYMAVTGLPEPQEDHAVIMAKFAQDCLVKMDEVTRKLEVTLGPDTAELSVRIGIHSGPVTAGVLRSEKSRFQLFGDTVNTASRMESTGLKNKIQISQETADLLCAAGKRDWIAPRGDRVFAKGKGELSTFWLASKRTTQSIGRATASSVATPDMTVSMEDCMTISSSECVDDIQYESQKERVKSDIAAKQSKLKRLIKWNVEVLLQPLKAIVAHRDPKRRGPLEKVDHQASTRVLVGHSQNDGRNRPMTLLDEVVEIVTLPPFDRKRTKRMLGAEMIELDLAVNNQLLDYVSSIASLYQDNPFHNFEHASHVTMSANKLLQRIVAPKDAECSSKEKSQPQQQQHRRQHEISSDLHETTFGIASDPLVQFAILFAALIHDVDHPGVPNRELVEMKTEVAVRYQNKSVAEQNSVDVAWNLLMTTKYDELRNCIAGTNEELLRFRQLVVNLVMATDVLDKQLQELRKSRWSKAFPDLAASNDDGGSQDESQYHQFSTLDVANRKATIVMEHIIQASDVAHTMQHWQMFSKWNERLFREVYMRYLSGGGDEDMDPSLVWYQRELDFFDNYVISLANKLKECGVFGVSGDEYLTYALENRQEWDQKGESVVHSMVMSCQQEVEENGTLKSYRRLCEPQAGKLEAHTSCFQ